MKHLSSGIGYPWLRACGEGSGGEGGEAYNLRVIGVGTDDEGAWEFAGGVDDEAVGLSAAEEVAGASVNGTVVEVEDTDDGIGAEKLVLPNVKVHDITPNGWRRFQSDSVCRG